LPPVALSTVGGNAVNVAVQLALLGRSVAYLGAVGDDADGARIAEALRASAVDTSGLRLRPEPTAVTDLEMATGNDRRIVLEEFGACAAYRPSDEDIETLRTCACLHIGWLAEADGLKRRLAGSGVVISQDLAVNPDPAGATVAFASAGESVEHAHRLLEELVARAVPVAVVTCGALGSLCSAGAERLRMDAAPARIVDTTGAGDAFIAGFLDAYVAGRSLARCLEAARDSAARSCEHWGGFPQRPQALAR
jgi:fructoselysine 6-kinase